MRDRILAEEPKCLTTADVAKILQVTPRWVRWLARTEQLAYTQTRSGLWLFLALDVRRYNDRRAFARARSRRERLQALRPQMLRAGVGPRQASFRLVPAAASERSDPQAEVKASRSLKRAGRVR
jgi:hypothetical protein